MHTDKEPLIGKTFTEIETIVRHHGFPSYASKQIANWLYKKDITEISAMSNLSKEIRNTLSSHFIFGLNPPADCQTSVDGTKKYVFKIAENKFIESVFIPDKSRATLCVSTQVGCRMGCKFCMTARQGFQGNLNSNEIVNQIRSIPEWLSLTNIVFMGMGEPFDNYDELLKSINIIGSEYGFAISNRKITVSTIGIIPRIQPFLENTKCNLAVSLHSPFEEERQQLMPIETTYTLKQVIAAIRAYNPEKQRRITFEYIVFKNFNDSRRHINELARILNGVRCRINLMRFHSIPGFSLESPDEEALIEFRDNLNKKGIVATIRASRGKDILAACGLLSTKQLNTK